MPAAAPVTPSAPLPETASRSPWRSLRHTGMRWWSAANFLSNAGTWMQLTVQNLLVLQITGSAAATGLSVSVQAAPALFISVFGGAAVDRWPRRTTVAVSQALLGAVAFTTALLVALGRLDLTGLLLLAAVTGVIATVDGPACALLGNDLVPAEDLPSAIGVGALVHSAGRLVGTALAGVTVGFLGTASAYLANGLSFLFVASVVPFLRPVRDPRGEGDTGPRAAPSPSPPDSELSVREGLAFFARRPRLVALACVSAISSVFGRNYGLTLAVLVTGPLAAGAGAFGTVSAVLAAGGIVGAVLGGRMRRPSVRLVGVLAAGGGLLQAVAGLSPSLLVLLVLVLPMAVVESVSDTAMTAVLQTDPPAHLRGRVLGIWSSIGTVWSLGGPPLLGLLMETAGARGALVGGGLLVAGTIATGFAVRIRRPHAPVLIRPRNGDAPLTKALETAA